MTPDSNLSPLNHLLSKYQVQTSVTYQPNACTMELIAIFLVRNKSSGLDRALVLTIAVFSVTSSGISFLLNLAILCRIFMASVCFPFKFNQRIDSGTNLQGRSVQLYAHQSLICSKTSEFFNTKYETNMNDI